MDVKCGSGAFMKTLDEARALAESIVNTAKYAHVNCSAIITRMDYPLGEMIGNACELWEALECFKPSSEYSAILRERIEYDKHA